VDELEQEYKGKIDIIRLDLTTTAGYCEYQKYGFSHIPAMIYIDAEGNQVGTTDEVQDKAQLQKRLEELLTQ
jgi:hypothetical protein